MSALPDLFGDSIVDGDGGKVDVKDLTEKGTVVGLYFSASWCPPCKMFTNQLIRFFNNVNTREDVKFKVIFLSSDETEEDFKEYFAKMPWFAVDYKDRMREAQLSQHFKVEGIPTLILLDGSSGDVITQRGRPMVMNDPQGKDFPWRKST